MRDFFKMMRIRNLTTAARENIAHATLADPDCGLAVNNRHAAIRMNAEGSDDATLTAALEADAKPKMLAWGNWSTWSTWSTWANWGNNIRPLRPPQPSVDHEQSA